MAKNVQINGVVYNNVPSVVIPQSGSGNATFYETSDATAMPEYILSGYTAYGASGKINGTLTAANVSQDSTTKVLSIS